MPEQNAKNVRTERLASSIHRLLQEKIARGLNDPRVRGLVTVTRVEMLDEGRIARAYVTVMPEDKAELTMHGLRDATNHLRRAVMSKIRVRLMPKLEIYYDSQLKRQTAVLAAIAKVERERLDIERADAQAASDGDPASGAASSEGRASWPERKRADAHDDGEPHSRPAFDEDTERVAPSEDTTTGHDREQSTEAPRGGE